MGNETSKSVPVGEIIPNDIHVKWKGATTMFDWPAPEGMAGCSADGALFVFGGVTETENEGIVETNDLLRLDLVRQSWEKVQATGDLPAPRAGASLVAVGRRLFLWGGLNGQQGWLEDLHEFNIDSKQWSKVSEEGTKPRPRDKLQGVAIDTMIYYFGGFGPTTAADEWEEEEELEEDEEEEDEETTEIEGAQFGWFNDLWVFDTETKKWSQPIQMNLGVPSARAAHSMCAVGKNLVIFGGRSSESRLNDIHIFDTETRKWRMMDQEIKGQLPAPRSFHAAVSVGSRVVVLGGRGTSNESLADIHIFDTESCAWLQPLATGELPCARDQHVAAVAGEHLVVFGGTADFSSETQACQTHLKDTYIADTKDFLQGGPKQASGVADS